MFRRSLNGVGRRLRARDFANGAGILFYAHVGPNMKAPPRELGRHVTMALLVRAEGG